MGFNGLIHLTVGDQTYEIYATHKCERWSSDNPTHGLNEVFREKENFEIIFAGHRHIPAISDLWIRNQWVLGIRNSSYKTTDYFIDHKNLKKSPYFLPCVLLDSEEHEIISFRDLREAIKFL